jgi:hypothetical protein
MTEELPDDNYIAKLLSVLKDKTPGYPPELLAHRRAAYEQGMAGLGIGLLVGDVAQAGAAAGGAAGPAHGGWLSSAWSTETILKALIVTALVVEGAGGAILYHQRLLHRNVPPPTSSLTATLPSPTSTPNPSLSATTSATTSATLTFVLTPLFTFAPGSGNPPPNTPTRTPRGNKFGHTPTPPGQRTPTEGPNGH